MLWLALLSYVGAVFTKLVVRNEDEIYLEDGSMDAQRIFAEADVINSTIRQSEHCSFVDEELKYFEYFIVDEEGTEERNIIEAQIPIDNIIDSRQVTNIHEPWITGHIILRCKIFRNPTIGTRIVGYQNRYVRRSGKEKRNW